MADNNALAKVKKLQGELESNIVERSNEIEGSLAALISKVHVLFLGPPGTAKSLLAENICRAIIGGKFFRWLMTKYTTPEEIFGPPSLKGLENDEYRRITKNKLAECIIAFLDEIFKANSSILNTLLTAINERKFDNNGDEAMNIPLLSCFGASNELPQGEELGALYDRFMMRYWVKPIQDDSNFCNLLSGNVGETAPTVQLTIEEINELNTLAAEINFTQEMLGNMRKIQTDLKNKGVTASDRRWKSAVNVLKALALLRGQDEVTGDELEALADMMWHKPEDRRTILEVVSQYGNPLNLKAIEYLDMATEVYAKWNNADKDSKEMAAIQAHKQIKEILKTIKVDLHGRADSETRRLKETQKTLKEYTRTLTMKMMEIDEDDEDSDGDRDEMFNFDD
jgi:MoxR-like ATPase